MKASKNPNSILERVSKVDKSDLKGDLDSWPFLASECWNNTEVPLLEQRQFNRVLLAGMGGSGLTGELIVDLAHEEKSEISFETVKDYHLPSYCDQNTLVVGMSSSGNTEETLSVLSESYAKGLTCVSCGSGGLIESFSKEKWNFEFIRTSMLKVPRSSLPGIFYPVLKFLMANELIHVSKDEINESIEVLNKVRKPRSSPKTDPANFASTFIGRENSIPILYASIRTRGVAIRARQSFNENAKMHAFNGEVPELCHNDIVAWDSRDTVVRGMSKLQNMDQTAIFLRLGEDDPVELRMRFRIVEQIVQRAKGKTTDAPYWGRSYLARIFSMLYFLEYVSYYTAIQRGIDPIKTPSIQRLKKELSSRLSYVSRL